MTKAGTEICAGLNWRLAGSEARDAGGGLLWDFDFGIAARCRCVNRGDDPGNLRLDRRPVVRTQNHQCHLSAGKVLLIPDLLIRRDEQLEGRLFRRLQKRTVRQTGLPLKPHCYDRMISFDQKTEFLRNAFVEKDLHLACKA